MKAFPTHSITVSNEARITGIGGQDGMDLRDYFAAAALPMAMKECCDAESYNINDAATMAYHYADAMMDARQS